MRLIQLSCPACNAQLDIDRNRRICFCMYCGTKLLIEEDKNTYNEECLRDELYAEAGRVVIQNNKGSVGLLQRKFQIGFNRALRILDMLTEDGVVGKEIGCKPREILMTIEEFENFVYENGL